MPSFPLIPSNPHQNPRKSKYKSFVALPNFNPPPIVKSRLKAQTNYITVYINAYTPPHTPPLDHTRIIYPPWDKEKETIKFSY